MLEFNLTSSPYLFAAPASGIWVAYCWPPPSEPAAALSPPSVPIPLQQALLGPGSFLFSTAPGLDIDLSAVAIVAALTEALASQTFAGTRAIAWLADPTHIVAEGMTLLGFQATSIQQMRVAPGQQLPIIPTNLTLNVGNGVPVTYTSEDDTLTFTPTENNMMLQGPAWPPGQGLASATLAFSGPAAGAFRFAAQLSRGELYSPIRWGFQLLYDTDSAERPVRSQWYPLADGARPDRSDLFNFEVSIDPTDPTNSRIADRTYLAFADPAACLVSGFRTADGDSIHLQPIVGPAPGEQAARLVLALGNPGAPSAPDYNWGPEGDFIMILTPPKDGARAQLLCGLTPTETLSFRAGPAEDPAAGDRLRFTANREAKALAYPPRPTSPVGPPVDPKAPRMDGAFRTPWATIVPAPGGAASHYSAQPKGSPLFGFDKIVAPTDRALLGFVDPGYELARPDPFPLLPYGLAPLGEFGVSFTESQLAGVEQFAAAPTRRTVIGAPGAARASRGPRLAAAPAGGPDWAATPSGLLAQLDPDAGHWASVVAGANFNSGPMWMAFSDPPPKLQQALQTANLFLVAADATHLGVPASRPATGPQPPAPGGRPVFYNKMSIEGWEISVDTGQANAYNDYNNLLIIKGCKGKLVDLVGKPEVWTQREDFSVPSGDPSETVILSQWIESYLQDALQQTSPYFDNFKAIVQDENWTGILVLKASLTGLPSNLAGLLSVIDKSQCYAHHFGITISPVGIDRSSPGDPSIAMTDSSAIFQLVYYVDPSFDPSAPAPLPPSASGPFDFKLLTLEALFENSAVLSFDSYAQLTLGQFFGDGVSHMGDAANVYNTILLKGAYQRNGEVGVFMLDSLDDNLFFLDSAIINKVEITKAQFNTVGPTRLRFDLWGFIDYNVLQGVDPATQKQDVGFDLFGFGAPSAAPGEARQGLCFSGLSVDLDTGASPWAFGFNVSDIAFDASRSTPRKGSLYTDFALTLTGLLSGDDSAAAAQPTDPTAQNYLTVPTNAPLSGVSGSPWYALQFGVDLGTMGALAGSAGLNSSLIAAWAPTLPGPPVQGNSLTTYNAMAGLRLPGVTAKAKMLSLQGVLALSIGAIRLTYAPQDAKNPKPYWVLWLSDIALKFLGLLKIPPNGAIGFACFGNPDADGSSTALGWYAVYNETKKKQERERALASSRAGTMIDRQAGDRVGR